MAVTPKRRPCRLQSADFRLQTSDFRLQTAGCRPCRPCKLCRSCKLSTFFLTLDSLFSVLQLPSSAQYVLMLAIYPQATQSQHLTVNSIDKRVYKEALYGKFPLLVLNILKSSININSHIVWAQISSRFDGLVVLLRLSNLLLVLFYFSISLVFIPLLIDS